MRLRQHRLARLVLCLSRQIDEWQRSWQDDSDHENCAEVNGYFPERPDSDSVEWYQRRIYKREEYSIRLAREVLK